MARINAIYNGREGAALRYIKGERKDVEPEFIPIVETVDAATGAWWLELKPSRYP